MSHVMASSCVLLPSLLFTLTAFDKSWIALIIRSLFVNVGCVFEKDSVRDLFCSGCFDENIVASVVVRGSLKVPSVA